MNPGGSARRLLRRCRQAGVATHSCRLQGYPYASVVPLMLDHEANPIMLLSRLAEHTGNLQADERASIVAHVPDEDIQAASRITLLGACRRADDDRRYLADRYLRYFPGAAQLLDLDFDFYRLTPAAARYIGGFGSVHWLAGQAIKPPPSVLPDLEARLLEHANTIRAEDLRDCCRRMHAFTAHEVRAIGVDCDGFDVRADANLLRFEFADTVHDEESARSALEAAIRADRG